MSTRRKYDNQFKIDAVDMMKCSDKTASEIASAARNVRTLKIYL